MGESGCADGASGNCFRILGCFLVHNSCFSSGLNVNTINIKALFMLLHSCIN